MPVAATAAQLDVASISGSIHTRSTMPMCHRAAAPTSERLIWPATSETRPTRTPRASLQKSGPKVAAQVAQITTVVAVPVDPNMDTSHKGNELTPQATMRTLASRPEIETSGAYQRGNALLIRFTKPLRV